MQGEPGNDRFESKLGEVACSVLLFLQIVNKLKCFVEIQSVFFYLSSQWIGIFLLNFAALIHVSIEKSLKFLYLKSETSVHVQLRNYSFTHPM